MLYDYMAIYGFEVVRLLRQYTDIRLQKENTELCVYLFAVLFLVSR